MAKIDYISFKQTEIGKIPQEWEVVRLDEVVDINQETIDPTKSFANKKFRYIDIDSVENGSGIIRGAKEILGKNAPSRARRVIHYNDVIMSTVRPYLKAFTIVPKKFDNQICSTGFAVLTCKGKVTPSYLLYTIFSKTIIEQCNRMMTGGQYPALSSSQVEKLKLPLPPLPEQQKIAEVLSTSDEALHKVDDAIQRTERLKKGLMQELLTGKRRIKESKGQRVIESKGYKETEIGRIPKGWEVARLGDICDQRNEIIQPTREGIVKFVGLEHIESGKTSIRSFSSDSNVKSSKFKFYKGDILYGKLRPYLDKAVITDFEGICSTDLLVLNPEKTKSFSGFLNYTLHYDRFVSHAKSTTSGTNHPRTSWKAIAKFKLPLPPLLEQQKIAEILSTVDKRLELLREKKERFERVKRGLMNDLLTGRKRVKVGA
ncbi:MAG: restriction endonuclease subunit S [Nitrospinae bacterium]|nr:restriction endonuclease subunit S [Nitrospinota bacterium]